MSYTHVLPNSATKHVLLGDCMTVTTSYFVLANLTKLYHFALNTLRLLWWVFFNVYSAGINELYLIHIPGFWGAQDHYQTHTALPATFNDSHC
jgi:hypothetical protein